MGLLDSLAQGLKSAGGTLNPQVYQANEAEQLQANQQKTAMQNAMLGHVIQAIQNGSMQAPAGSPFQASPQAQAQLAAAEKQKQYAAAVAALGPNATQEQLANVGAQFATPDKLMDTQQKSLDRQEAARLAQEAIKQKAADRMLELQTKNLDARERAIEMANIRADAQKDLVRLSASLRQPQQPHVVAVEDPNNPGSSVYVPASDAVGMRPFKESTAKALPASASKAIFENNQNLRRAQQALDLIEGKDVGEMKGDKGATGFKGFLPDAVLQRVDPKGVDARAAIGDLGSLVIHDRSGAAVTASEFPRLQPFIPSPRDDPATVKKKLKRFVQIYQQTTDDMKNFHKESGYKVPDSNVETPAAPAASGGWSIRPVGQ